VPPGFLKSTAELATDFGCGVIYKLPQRAVAASHRLNGARDRLAFAWDAARHDDATRFHFFAQHRRDFLNLKSVEEFSALEGFAPALAAMTEG